MALVVKGIAEPMYKIHSATTSSCTGCKMGTMKGGRGPRLHVKEGGAGVGAADGKDPRGAHFLQGQQEHGPAKDGPPAAPEAAGVVGALLMLQLPAGRLKGHASVKDDVVAVGLQAIVGVHPQCLHG